MKDYIDYILKKEKKPVEIEKIYKKIEDRKRKIDPNYVLSDTEVEDIERILNKGVEKYEYYKTPHGKYTLISRTSFRKGNFRGNRIGGGTVICNTTYVKKDGTRLNREERFTLERENCNNAVDGDIVLIDAGGNGIKPSVVKVIHRNIESVVGEVTKIGPVTYVKPIDKKKQLLTIELDEEIEDGSIVSVSLSEIDEEKLKEKLKINTNHYMGKISRVCLHEDGPHHDALLEAFKCGMPEGFSDASLKQAASIPSFVSEKETQHRYDFTKLNVFSIDGDDTKDKDDAISLEKIPNGYRLGVHIADVAHYVKEGSPIDLDAFRKGTSYYFNGLVNPQLPPELSNGICSLNEGVVRLTKSIIVDFDENGNVIGRFLVPSYIKSKKSMTYNNVNKLLRGEHVEGYEPYKETLQQMSFLAQMLEKKRLYNGAVMFNRPEVRFKHDELGRPIDVDLRYADGKAETMIEEFMLVANNNVTEIFDENGLPCIYRIHDVPKIERLSDFLKLLKAINMPFEFNEEDIIKSKDVLHALCLHINNNPALSPMLNSILIRCMSHASYNTINIGHYGTGYEKYCHFTSPIRRLADLAISRIIDECYFEMNSSIKERNKKKWNSISNDYALQATMMEKVEEDVEKNVLYMETAAYLGNYIGQEFEGTIVNLSNNGIGVQLDNLLEGKIRNRYLDGSYVYNTDTYTLVSLDGKGNYYLGDRLRLKLVGTSDDTKTVDFEVLEKIKENNIKDRHRSNQYVKSRANDRNKRPYN